MSKDRLREACRLGDEDVVRDMLETHQSNDTQLEASECTAAFNDALENNHVATASYLLSLGVPFNSSHIRFATHYKMRDMLEMMLQHGWDINKPLGRLSPPPLDLVVDNESMARWFLEHGADPNAQCDFDDTPLSSAVSHAPLEIIKLLFKHDGDVLRGELLHRAVCRELPDRHRVIEFLLDRGAPINKVMYQDHKEMYIEMAFTSLGTPMHVAAEKGLSDVVKLLLAHGADPLIEDSMGLSVIQRAEKSCHMDIADYLRHSITPKAVSTNTFTSGLQAGIDLKY